MGTSSRYFFPPLAPSTVQVRGSNSVFPVNRIFCVGRNYAEHAREMKAEVDREAPFYFLKPASAIVEGGAAIPYPPGTSNFQHEVELVVAIGAPAFRIGLDRAPSVVFGYACGLDMTRRDLQLAARERGRPWDLGKAVEQSAVIGKISRIQDEGPLQSRRITVTVNGEIRQDALLSQMIWSVAEIIAHLSGFYHLAPGDLIYTGTPAGVGPVVPHDRIEGRIDGLDPVILEILPKE